MGGRKGSVGRDVGRERNRNRGRGRGTEIYKGSISQRDLFDKGFV